MTCTYIKFQISTELSDLGASIRGIPLKINYTKVILIQYSQIHTYHKSKKDTCPVVSEGEASLHRLGRHSLNHRSRPLHLLHSIYLVVSI